jgi:hypothetical protein
MPNDSVKLDVASLPAVKVNPPDTPVAFFANEVTLSIVKLPTADDDALL